MIDQKQVFTDCAKEGSGSNKSSALSHRPVFQYTGALMFAGSLHSTKWIGLYLGAMCNRH